ncbi:MAG: putative acetolactate synthase large subunit [Rhodospirillales bacterium]|nr:putative acetolactate synthase large subunit [Rhodospirillales bacterium]
MARAAAILVDCLVRHGVDRVFCVPGESYLSVIDALYDAKSIDVVTVRQEGGGAFMAVADAKLTQKPGVMFVSRGPGAMNAAIGVHVAQQDAVPMILFVGQVAREDIGRNAFQEVDYPRTYGAMAKWVFEVAEGAKLAETVRRAFHIAQSGTPGPVVIVLPEDMLDDDVAPGGLGGRHVPMPAPDRWTRGIARRRGSLAGSRCAVVPPPGSVRQHASALFVSSQFQHAAGVSRNVE